MCHSVKILPLVVYIFKSSKFIVKVAHDQTLPGSLLACPWGQGKMRDHGNEIGR